MKSTHVVLVMPSWQAWGGQCLELVLDRLWYRVTSQLVQVLPWCSLKELVYVNRKIRHGLVSDVLSLCQKHTCQNLVQGCQWGHKGMI